MLTMKYPLCINCGKELTEVFDEITKSYTGHIWHCECMSDNVDIFIG